ncbi:MAG: efflux RND transporter periplasmic adaptor subunit [Akkermansiaceae bacterium]|nr:efflux RND transporter periplasmic adaptor subunit [Akkermansiaceae bacterium]MCP5549712.1 efflux RND transporter periplasmic adaptor subunit [Akkermansiaceae bacterium]
MKPFLKIALGAGILLAGASFAALAFLTRPVAEKKPHVEVLPVVRTRPVRREEVRIVLPSQGLVEARKRTQVAAEVGGKIVWVSEKFDTGGEFEKDEPVLRIEDADYLAARAQAESALADARVALETEKARVEQALRDWEALGREGQPSELTLRKPQVAGAEARVKAAGAALEKAARDVERTEIRAPYDGRLAAIRTELGAFVAPGAPVAEIYTTAPYEVRLPVSLDDWAFLQRDAKGGVRGGVTLSARVGGDKIEWPAEIVRVEGEVERSSRSIYLVAETTGLGPGPNPVGSAPVQPGLFVQAAIVGQTRPDVYRVPAEAFVDLDRVMLVDDDDRLRFATVKVLRRDGDEVLVSGGLEDARRFCLTELSDAIEGRTRVKPRDEAGDEVPVLSGEPAATAAEVPKPAF